MIYLTQKCNEEASGEPAGPSERGMVGALWQRLAAATSERGAMSSTGVPVTEQEVMYFVRQFTVR